MTSKSDFEAWWSSDKSQFTQDDEIKAFAWKLWQAAGKSGKPVAVKVTDEEVTAALMGWFCGTATYVVANRINQKRKEMVKTPAVLRHLKNMEKRGLVARVQSNYAVQLSWQLMEAPHDSNNHPTP